MHQRKSLKIGQYLAKIWTKLCGLLFGGHPVYTDVQFIDHNHNITIISALTDKPRDATATDLQFLYDNAA